MAYRLSAKSEKALAGVHPSLVRVVRRAIELTPVDFRVTEGLRTFERQKELYDAGKSKTMKSRHLLGYAVDVVALPGGVVSWDMKHYKATADAFKQAGAELRIPIEWGGDWRTFKDGPHFQLSASEYR